MLVFFAAVVEGYEDPYPYMYCQNRTCSVPYEGSKLQTIVNAVYR